MSTTAPAASTLPQAPWKQLFNKHLGEMKPPQFVLGTLDKAPEGSPVEYVPRVRYCIFRGFWAELPENKHNDAERNSELYHSDCPTFTTDVRMEKVGQIFKTSAGHAESDDQVQGSGGGGPVEAVWWVEGETQTQWRVAGKAYVIADDIEGSEESSGVRTVKSEVGKRMRALKEGGENEWSWQRELTGFFGNQSPAIKGEIIEIVIAQRLANTRIRLLQEPAPRPARNRTFRQGASPAWLKGRRPSRRGRKEELPPRSHCPRRRRANRS